jgi:hypothetical protein
MSCLYSLALLSILHFSIPVPSCWEADEFFSVDSVFYPQFHCQVLTESFIIIYYILLYHSGGIKMYCTLLALYF